MGMSYENQRDVYDQIRAQYVQYLNLYKEFNNGSIEGATDFGQFYWQMTWVSKYDKDGTIGNQGY